MQLGARPGSAHTLSRLPLFPPPLPSHTDAQTHRPSRVRNRCSVSRRKAQRDPLKAEAVKTMMVGTALNTMHLTDLTLSKRSKHRRPGTTELHSCEVHERAECICVLPGGQDGAGAQRGSGGWGWVSIFFFWALSTKYIQLRSHNGALPACPAYCNESPKDNILQDSKSKSKGGWRKGTCFQSSPFFFF